MILAEKICGRMLFWEFRFFCGSEEIKMFKSQRSRIAVPIAFGIGALILLGGFTSGEWLVVSAMVGGCSLFWGIFYVLVNWASKGESND
jgi:hypothetical protein